MKGKKLIPIKLNREQKKLVVKNRYLVPFLARKFVGRGLDLDDLIQEGFFGLMRAAQKYEKEKSEFSTYASIWIRSSIQRALAEKSEEFHLPVYMRERLTSLYKAIRNYEQKYGVRPSKEYLADKLKISIEKVEEITKIYQTYFFSLNQAVAGEEDSFESFIPDTEKNIDPDEILLNQNFKKDVEQYLEVLSNREEMIIRMRYGIDCEDGYSKTLEEIGSFFGVSRERIRQIEKIAMEKLKRCLRRKKRTKVYQD